MVELVLFPPVISQLAELSELTEIQLSAWLTSKGYPPYLSYGHRHLLSIAKSAFDSELKEFPLSERKILVDREAEAKAKKKRNVKVCKERCCVEVDASAERPRHISMGGDVAIRRVVLNPLGWGLYLWRPTRPQKVGSDSGMDLAKRVRFKRWFAESFTEAESRSDTRLPRGTSRRGCSVETA